MNLAFRRGASSIGLRGLGLLRHHYGTLLSAIVIAVCAVVALSSDAFRSSGRRPELPAILREVPDGRDIGADTAQTLIWSPPAAELSLRSVVYFIYETEPQRQITEAGLRDLARARFLMQGPEDTNVFLRAGTPAEAEATAQEIRRAEDLAKLQGYAFQVVDLRAN